MDDNKEIERNFRRQVVEFVTGTLGSYIKFPLNPDIGYYDLFLRVNERGGYDNITAQNWSDIADEISTERTKVNAKILKTRYRTLILEYERILSQQNNKSYNRLVGSLVKRRVPTQNEDEEDEDDVVVPSTNEEETLKEQVPPQIQPVIPVERPLNPMEPALTKDNGLILFSAKALKAIMRMKIQELKNDFTKDPTLDRRITDKIPKTTTPDQVTPRKRGRKRKDVAHRSISSDNLLTTTMNTDSNNQNISNENTILDNENTILNNENTIPNNENTILNNENTIPNNENTDDSRTNLNNNTHSDSISNENGNVHNNDNGTDNLEISNIVNNNNVSDSIDNMNVDNIGDKGDNMNVDNDNSNNNNTNNNSNNNNINNIEIEQNNNDHTPTSHELKNDDNNNSIFQHVPNNNNNNHDEDVRMDINPSPEHNKPHPEYTTLEHYSTQYQPRYSDPKNLSETERKNRIKELELIKQTLLSQLNHVNKEYKILSSIQ